MMKNKTFDCVKMKNEIQAKLRQEYDALTPEEIRKRRREKLETSDDLIARKWRRLIQALEQKRASAHR